MERLSLMHAWSWTKDLYYLQSKLPVSWEVFIRKVSAPLGHCDTWCWIISVGAPLMSIQGLSEGSKTWGRPIKQFSEWEQRAGFHITVTSPLVYSFLEGFFIGNGFQRK